MYFCKNTIDLGLWNSIDPKDLIIPLDVHVHQTALALGITSRKGTDIKTATEITDFLKECFPEDPCLGDFALFAYPVAEQSKNRNLQRISHDRNKTEPNKDRIEKNKTAQKNILN